MSYKDIEKIVVAPQIVVYKNIFKHSQELIDLVEEDREDFISVAVIEDKAYWVINNMFYQADIIDGEVDKTSSRPVDAFQMSSKEINKMLSILDNLSEG